jgi:predicted transcriptional regulator YheO
MAKNKDTLTKSDLLILESYKITIEALAAYLGDAYEFVLHDIRNLDHSVIKLANAFH